MAKGEMKYLAICQPLDGSQNAKLQWCASVQAAEKTLMLWKREPPFNCANIRYTIAECLSTIEG